jgi:RNA polymerase sigma factor (sigma-70 family)
MTVLQSSAGDAVGREFDQFVASASPGLLRAAYLLTGDRSDAEDLLQNALLRVFRRWQSISGPPSAYAFTVLVNLSRDHRRRLRRRPTTVAGHDREAPAGIDPVGRLLDRAEVVQAARCLPPVQQSVIACRFLLELSVGETAVALELPEGTVKSYTSRALTKMRGLLVSESSTSGVEVRNAQ